MADPAFSSRSDCPIPFVPEIEPDLIVDCEIPPVPDPFFQAPPLPPIIPPITLGCPPISITGTASKVGKNDPLVFQGSGGTYDPDGDDCFPLIDLDLNIPFACPVFSISSRAPRYSKSGRYSFRVVQRTDDPPDCSFDFDLDIEFPCTSLSIRSKSISIIPFSSDPLLHINVEPDWENNCTLNFDMEIDLPLIRHTDVIVHGSGDGVSKMSLSVEEVGSLVLHVWKLKPSCTYC